MTSDKDELVFPLDPIYAGMANKANGDRKVAKAKNVAKYNRDTAKIIDRCWSCPLFGIGAAEQDRTTTTKCLRCRETMLKAIELRKK